MIDFDRLLKSIVKSGKLLFGAKSAVSAAKMGRALAFILASNCPPVIKKEIESFAVSAKIPIHYYPSSGIELGMALGKPFAVATITIRSVSDPQLVETLRNPKT
jgi:large subunit ribosomal protein L30e